MSYLGKANDIVESNIGKIDGITYTNIGSFNEVPIYSPPAGPDAYTVLLIHSDAADGNTTFTDSSASAHTISVAAGDIHHEIDQHKFCGSSIYFDGTVGTYLSIPDSDDWNFGSGDFTIDFWTYILTGANYDCFFCHGNANQHEHFLQIFEGKLDWNIRGGLPSNVGILETATAISNNVWHHIGLVRAGNVFKLFIDGVLKASQTKSGSIENYTNDLRFGSRPSYNYGPIQGYKDEIRISKGIGRWTSNFTPDTSPYSYTCNT